MKAGLFAFAASSVLGSTVAAAHHGHEAFHKRWAKPSYFDYACCKTVVTTTVYATMESKPVPTAYSSTSSSTTSTSTVYTTASPVVPVPTPIVTVLPTPGTYEFSATTVTVDHTITVVAEKTTGLTPGPNTYGGITTSVTAPTTITYPYVTSSTSGTVVTSYITDTTYVCPSAGTYTPVAPESTTISTSTVMVYPVPATYAPGTYTAPATTVTATKTDYVYVCPLETVTVQSTVEVSPSPVASPVETSTTPEASPTETPATTEAPAPATTEAPAPATTEAPSSSPAATTSEAAPVSSPSSSPSGGDISVNGNKWAMTYTPYAENGDCKTADEVDSDLAVIAGKGFTTIRIYATDCSGLVNVGASCKTHGLKIIVGVFIKADGIAGATPQLGEIAQWGSAGNWDLVVMAVIGNEAIFNQYCTAEELAAFITEAKSTLGSSGYSGPVTTTEPVDTLQESTDALCPVIDVVAANIQPFFNGDVVAAQAGTFVKGQLDLVAAACPGKTAYNLECGWPNQGNPNGASVPGPSEQAAAITDIIDKCGDKTAIFSFDNDAWKEPGPYGVEQYFGCSELFQGY